LAEAAIELRSSIGLEEVVEAEGTTEGGGVELV
jgi:hypothetical protein